MRVLKHELWVKPYIYNHGIVSWQTIVSNNFWAALIQINRTILVGDVVKGESNLCFKENF